MDVIINAFSVLGDYLQFLLGLLLGSLLTTIIGREPEVASVNESPVNLSDESFDINPSEWK